LPGIRYGFQFKEKQGKDHSKGFRTEIYLHHFMHSSIEKNEEETQVMKTWTTLQHVESFSRNASKLIRFGPVQ
jgi:hypothetical protein